MTEGPWLWNWAVDGNGHADGRIYTDPAVNTLGLATCIAVSPRYASKEAWATTAPMLAAAPDLLAVARKLRTALDALRPFPLVVEPVAAALIAEADAAIAKAEKPLIAEHATTPETKP